MSKDARKPERQATARTPQATETAAAAPIAPPAADETNTPDREPAPPPAAETPAAAETIPPAPPVPAELQQQLDAARLRRLKREAMNGELARKRCMHCATLGAWTPYSSDGNILYVRCIGCGVPDKAVITIDEEAGDGNA